MLHISILDIRQPVPYLPGKIPRLTPSSHRNLQVLITKPNDRNSRDEERRPRHKCLYNPPLPVSLYDLGHIELPLDDLESAGVGSEVLRAGNEALTCELEDRTARDAVENDFIVERRGDELEISRLGLPDDEEVTSSGLGHEVIGTEEPEDLVVSELFALRYRVTISVSMSALIYVRLERQWDQIVGD